MIDWQRSKTVEWRVCPVDRGTWASGDPVPGIDSIECQSDASGESPLIDAGSMRLTGTELTPGYYRISMVARQDGATELVHLMTLLFEGVGSSVSHRTRTVTADGRSVLWPSEARLLMGDTYAPEGADGSEYVASLLRSVCHAPVIVDLGAAWTLGAPVWGTAGQPMLAHAWEVLRAGGRTLRIDGDGTIHVSPMPTEPALTLDAASSAMLLPGIESTLDITAVPNAYTAISGTESATSINDDPDSAASTVSRGYRYDVVDTAPKPIEGETLEAYARRRLAEASVVSEERTYTRKYVPGIHVGDVVLGAMPSQGLDGRFRIVSIGYELGGALSVTETATREVTLWQG